MRHKEVLAASLTDNSREGLVGAHLCAYSLPDVAKNSSRTSIVQAAKLSNINKRKVAKAKYHGVVEHGLCDHGGIARDEVQDAVWKSSLLSLNCAWVYVQRTSRNALNISQDDSNE